MMRSYMVLACGSLLANVLSTGEGSAEPLSQNTQAPTSEATNSQPQRFFLGSDRLDTRISALNHLSDATNPFAPNQGATFSGIRDRESGTTSLIVDGVLSYVLFNPKIGEGRLPEESFLSAVSLATYLDIDAEFVSREEADEGSVIFGVDGQIEVAGGIFDVQYLTFGTYFQTELQGDANIYGVNASWTPIRIGWSLGSGQTRSGRITDRFVWSTSANADLKFVDDPGSTDLQQSRYSWVGLEGKIHVIPFGDVEAERFYIDVGGKTYHDVQSGESADSYFVTLGAALDDNGNINMELKHTSGVDYSTLIKRSSLTWGVSIKF